MPRIKDSQNLMGKMAQFPKPIIYFFVLSHMVFGFDFGFAILLDEILRKLVQFLSYLLSVTFVLILMAPVVFATTMHKDITIWCSLFAYTGYVFVVKKSTYKIFNLIVDVNEIYEMMIFEKRAISIFAVIYTSFMINTKLAFEVIQSVTDNSTKTYFVDIDKKYNIFYHFPCSSFDVITMAEIIIYYYIYCCIKKLKESLRKSRQDVNLAFKKYAAIADCCDKIKPLYDDLVSLQLVTGLPAFMYSLITSLLYINDHDHWSKYSNRIVYAIVILLEISVPPLVTEMVNIQVDAIKMLLNDHLMNELDEKKIEEVIELLGYIEARPLHGYVWRFIPVDLSLVLNVLNLCTTYLIVILQFLHVYD